MNRTSMYDSNISNSEIIKKFIDLINSFNNPEAIEYYKEVRKQDAKLLAIQEKHVNILINHFEDKIKCYPASSFTAKTNLLGTSDIDINVLMCKEVIKQCIKDMSMILTYKFKEIRDDGKGNEHYVFYCFDDGIEIEFKFRDEKYFMEQLHKLHNYVDNIMSEELKIKITWAKKNLIDNKEDYAMFKKMYYHFAYVSANK